MRKKITRRSFLKKAAVTAALGGMSTILLTQKAPANISNNKKPNILFIFADDQCYETIAQLGLTDIETPHIDRLMNEGTTFTRAYNMGSWSGAVCVASRHMLNTGRFIWRAEEASKKAEEERASGRFWSENMKSAGYKTYFTGKWHVRANAEKCFDVTSNVRGGMPNQTPAGYNRPLPGKPDPWKRRSSRWPLKTQLSLKVLIHCRKRNLTVFYSIPSSSICRTRMR